MAPGMALPPVLFAPVLRAEQWVSIDLQQADILRALRSNTQLPVTVMNVRETLASLPGGKSLLRDFVYPRRIRTAAEKLGRCVLHVTDHAYGHLCHAHRPCVANCNDLHHLVDPDLQGVVLQRWKQRVFGLRAADKILAISAHLADEVRTHLGVTEDRVVALPGGIDTEVFRPVPIPAAASLLPAAAALRADCLLVLHVGSNMRLKNLPTLLRALRILNATHSQPVKLLKAGSALRGSTHESLIQDLGLGDHIVDLGLLNPPEVVAACCLAHVLSFPSLYEGFGRPTLEAQACELPCILADTPGMREIGGAGAAYHRGTDPEHLAHLIQETVVDSAVRRRLIAEGRRNVARFSWARYASDLVSVYREVAG